MRRPQRLRARRLRGQPWDRRLPGLLGSPGPERRGCRGRPRGLGWRGPRKRLGRRRHRRRRSRRGPTRAPGRWPGRDPPGRNPDPPGRSLGPRGRSLESPGKNSNSDLDPDPGPPGPGSHVGPRPGRNGQREHDRSPFQLWRREAGRGRGVVHSSSLASIGRLHPSTCSLRSRAPARMGGRWGGTRYPLPLAPTRQQPAFLRPARPQRTPHQPTHPRPTHPRPTHHRATHPRPGRPGRCPWVRHRALPRCWTTPYQAQPQCCTAPYRTGLQCWTTSYGE
jgi:hypothetical protein